MASTIGEEKRLVKVSAITVGKNRSRYIGGGKFIIIPSHRGRGGEDKLPRKSKNREAPINRG